MHLLAAALWTPIGVEGLTQTMMCGRRLRGEPAGSLRHEPDGFPPRLAQRANELSETTKLFTLLGTYIRKYHGSRYYGKAMNITRLLTAAYDDGPWPSTTCC